MLMTPVIVIMFISCNIEPDEPTYTVWTDTVTYSQYYNVLGSLSDGYYVHYELTNALWTQLAPSLTDDGKHNWTESDINKWFIGRGFGNSEANRETAWLMTIDHGLIASRSGSMVYMLLK